MSRAQGQFTIIDYNDALTLTGYIGCNHPKTQMFNPDNNSYTPNWASTNLVLTPSLYIIGTTTDQITSENVTMVKWYQGTSTTAIASGGNYTLSGTKSHILTVKANIMAGLPGVDFKCEITYRDPSTGLTLVHPLTISFSRVVNGSGIVDLMVMTPNGNVFKNMRAIGQITITNICDVVASDTPPENPYIGQLWVDTSVNPPETKVWNGDSWEVQNDLETIRVVISTLTTKTAELQSTIDGLNSYVGSMTQTIETITDGLGNEQQTVLEMQAQMSQLQQTIDGLTVQVTNQYAGGLNFIQNSAGLNGVSDDWVKTGTVTVDSSTDTQNNTTSDSCFVLGTNSTLKQTITGLVTGVPYAFSLRAKKTKAIRSTVPHRLCRSKRWEARS